MGRSTVVTNALSHIPHLQSDRWSAGCSAVAGTQAACHNAIAFVAGEMRRSVATAWPWIGQTGDQPSIVVSVARADGALDGEAADLELVAQAAARDAQQLRGPQ